MVLTTGLRARFFFFVVVEGVVSSVALATVVEEVVVLIPDEASVGIVVNANAECGLGDFEDDLARRGREGRRDEVRSLSGRKEAISVWWMASQ